jgi:predicted TPR repeat methyltransferase
MSTTQPGRKLTEINGCSDHFLERADQKLEQAITCHGEGRIDEAAVLYLQVLEVVPDNCCALFNLATIHQGSGELRKAIGCYKKVLIHDPENFQVLYNLACAYRDNGFPEQAAVTYQRSLEVEFEHPDIHYNLGVLYHQLGFIEESVESFEQTLVLRPEHFPTLYNLGTICFESSILNKALDFYMRAHAADPDDMDCCYNLGLTHFHLGRYDEAASCYEKVLAAAPEDAALHNTLGTVYRHLNEYERAAGYYQKALELQPDFGSACTNLAVVLQMLGDTSGAVTCFQKAVALGHDVESAEYMIAALTGESRSSAPRSYVESLFDSYAVTFDRSLVGGLDYDVPAKLYALHEDLDQSKTSYGRVIDLGCGTGLAGEQFRDFAETLIGVDLSLKMVEQAEQKGIYDQLHCDDIVDFLNNATVHYDLVLAADVMVYIGDLEPLFSAIAGRTSPGGLFLFSVEEHDGGGYMLRQSGRYAYSREYIEKTAAQNGFLVETAWNTNIRKEKDEWIAGCLFALQKS